MGDQLPSRGVLSSWLMTRYVPLKARQVLNAYISGRLVDREAIDYEAAQVVPVRVSEGKFTNTAYFLSYDEARAVVDAAVSVTDA